MEKSISKKGCTRNPFLVMQNVRMQNYRVADAPIIEYEEIYKENKIKHVLIILIVKNQCKLKFETEKL